MPKNIARTLFASCLFASIASLNAAAQLKEPLQEDRAEFRTTERAASKLDPRAYTIDPASIEIVKIGEMEETDMPGPVKAGIADNLVMIDQIVNLFTKVWDIIKQNAPVVSIDTQYAAAMPQGISAWNQLAEWKRPKSYLYSFSAKNLYGAKTVDVAYKVIYTYGGKYKGKGQYLTGVTVIPVKVNALWGYRFSLGAQVPDSTIANVGTDKDPVAALQVKLVWKIATALKESNGAGIDYIQGDGYFEEVAGPSALKEVKAEDLASSAPLLTDTARLFE